MEYSSDIEKRNKALMLILGDSNNRSGDGKQCALVLPCVEGGGWLCLKKGIRV